MLAILKVVNKVNSCNINLGNPQPVDKEAALRAKFPKVCAGLGKPAEMTPRQKCCTHGTTCAQNSIQQERETHRNAEAVREKTMSSKKSIAPQAGSTHLWPGRSLMEISELAWI